MTKWLLLLLFVQPVTDCQQRATTQQQPGLAGRWRLIEQAHSGPDDRPVRTRVSDTPRQVLTLSETGRVTVEGDRLANLRSFTTYRVDSTAEFMDYQNRLVFLPEPADADQLANFIRINGDTLRLIRPGRGASSSTFVRTK